MPESRPAIPSELVRSVLVEAGHACAVPKCRQTPVEIAHITPWSKAKCHEFSNLIALCPNCHARFDKGVIDLKSMRTYKAQIKMGVEVVAKIEERLERLEQDTTSSDRRSTVGFSRAVAVYGNRTCPIGIINGPRFVTLGLCTFVKPRRAVVPGSVLDQIVEVLSVQLGSAAVWEPSGMSSFVEEPAAKRDGDLRLIKVGPVPHDTLDILKANHPDIEDENLERYFRTNEAAIPCELRVYTGDHVGYLTMPDETQELRGAMELQFQDAFISFAGGSTQSRMHTRFLTPVQSSMGVFGAPVFRPDGVLIGLITDIAFVEQELGWRPVITTLLSLPELWLPSSSAPA